jgi:integrase/recombinase XerC/integrase/recombinase XerD
MIDDMYQPITIRNSVLAEHLAVFDIHIRKSTSPQTADTYERSLRCFLTFVIQDRKFKFRIKDFERYKTYLVESKQLQPQSIATYITALRRFSEYLVEVKVLPRNPSIKIHVSTRKEHKLVFFRNDELRMFFDSIDESTMQGIRDKALFLFMLGCMCGEQELQLATISNLSENYDVLNVSSRKKEKVQIVQIPQHVSSTLRTYLQMRFPEGAPSDAPLFHSLSNRTKGKAMSLRGIRETFKQRLKSSGISAERHDELSPYALRHSAGCIMAIAGYDFERIMQHMRVISPSIVQRYMDIAQKSEYHDLLQSLWLLE